LKEKKKRSKICNKRKQVMARKAGWDARNRIGTQSPAIFVRREGKKH
jgi:hypothetical protein